MVEPGCKSSSLWVPFLLFSDSSCQRTVLERLAIKPPNVYLHFRVLLGVGFPNWKFIDTFKMACWFAHVYVCRGLNGFYLMFYCWLEVLTWNSLAFSMEESREREGEGKRHG